MEEFCESLEKMNYQTSKKNRAQNSIREQINCLFRMHCQDELWTSFFSLHLFKFLRANLVVAI